LSVVFYISGHGFGHASRSALVVNALGELAPELPIGLRTTVPEWFLRANVHRPVNIITGATDTGVVQPDSLSIDEAETARRAREFYAEFDTRVEREAAILREHRGTLVVGDIPPLAFAAASAAGLPSVAISNFTWDWIYGGLPGFDSAAPGVREQIAAANAQATLTLRLPFAGGFDGMRPLEDVPLVARRATVTRHDARARLGLPSTQRLVLATFGGHGGSVPLASAADDPRQLVVATEYEVPRDAPRHPNLRVVTRADMQRAGVTYTDLLAACDAVVTKLGYGIVSECLANGVPLLYTLRGRFIEQEVFMREMPAVMRSRLIDREDLVAGRWGDALDALLAQPAPASTLRADGADVIARRILARLQR